MTEYIVLTKHGEDGWAQIGKDKVTAASARAAISEMLKTRPAIEGEFVAIPLRSWHPLKVTVETQHRLKFS